MKTRYLLGVLAGCCLASLPLSAQTFVGSDDFDAGFTSRWDYSYRLNGATQGNLSFNSNRLDFSKAGAGVGNFHRLWDSDGTVNPNVTSSSYSTSWTMTMAVTNTITGLAGGEFTTIGFQVFNDANSYSALMLTAGSGGYSVQAEGTGFSRLNVATVDNTDVLLRLTWDASAKSLDASYSLDGSNFTAVATFLPQSQWDNSNSSLAVNNGFNFGVFGNSDTPAMIGVGSVYADNFSVSAVPEPSTYAALAGLGALGLVWWRRRQQRSVAA
jgi:hypothetical protein